MNQEPIISCYTLYDSVNEVMALNQIDIKKYLASYLIAAKQAWRDLFWNTLYTTTSVWLTVKAGDPYPYVDIPRDCLRLLYVGGEDHCGDVQPYFYNNVMNVVVKPKVKKCGCETCECSGLCEDLNSTVFTTNVLFTINGVDYVEKTWIKYGNNGDILEYKETPYKQYNDTIGDGGDFNNDYNNDFSGGSHGLSNFTIATRTTQRKICALQTYPCGCPKDTPENEQLVRSHCSCFVPFFGHRRREHCEHFLRDTNRTDQGEVKISDCGTRIYFRPPARHHHHRNDPNHKRIPDFLLVSYQTNGDPKLANNQIQVPEYAKVAIWAGTFCYIKMFNPKYRQDEKDSAKYLFNAKINDLITFLNPLSLQDLSDVQDLPVRW